MLSRSREKLRKLRPEQHKMIMRLLFVGLFVIIGTAFIYYSRAATPSASIEPESQAVSAPASIFTDSNASSGSAVRFSSAVSVPSQCASGGTYLWSNLVACGWPGPGNTGVPAGTNLTSAGSQTITTNNTVIDGANITGDLTINAQNVTIRNSRITYSGSGGPGSGAIKILSGASATISHVEINGQSAVHACIWHEGAAMTVQYVNCHHTEDGIFSWADTGTAGSGDNFSITDTYIHDLTAVEANGHWDGFQTEGASNGIIDHNTFYIRTDGTSATSVWDSQKNSNNIVIKNNLISGAGFSMYAQDYSPSESNPVGGYSITNILYQNNKFSNVQSGCGGGYGIWFFRSAWTYQGGPTGNWGANGNIRSGNVMMETGLSLDSGNPAGCT